LSTYKFIVASVTRQCELIVQPTGKLYKSFYFLVYPAGISKVLVGTGFTSIDFTSNSLENRGAPLPGPC
jgi:hypothetical protein